MTTEALLALVFDTESVMAKHSDDMARRLLWELDGMIADYHRSLAIVQLSGNYSSKGHLCTSMLSSLKDDELKQVLQNVRAMVLADLERRGIMDV